MELLVRTVVRRPARFRHKVIYLAENDRAKYLVTDNYPIFPSVEQNALRAWKCVASTSQEAYPILDLAGLDPLIDEYQGHTSILPFTKLLQLLHGVRGSQAFYAVVGTIALG
jgi:hypothetical protein